MPTTAEQQLILEFINRSRDDPAGEFAELISGGEGVTAEIEAALDFFGVDLDALLDQLSGYASVPPLAFSEILTDSAQTHNDLMNEYDEQSHNLPGEPGLLPRIEDAGYDNVISVGESVYAYAYDELFGHAGFYIDWGYDSEDVSGGSVNPNFADLGDGIQDPPGHRDAMLNGTFTEVGIAWDEADAGNSIGPFVTTQHYGTTSDYEAQLLGVVFDDSDDNDFYGIGEGLGGITITAVGAAGTFVTTSWASGGYQMVLPDGIYDVTFSGTGLDGVITTTVTMDGDNIKEDAIADEAVAGGKTETGTDADETMAGTQWADTLNGGRGEDTITGGEGDDDLSGAGGNDSIDGGAGHDLIRGGREEDIIYGGEGDDQIRGQKNGDTLYGDAGDDNIKGGGGNDTIYGGADDDFIKGGSRADELYGDDGDDRLIGNSFDDLLYGGDGNDTLLAGGDNDTLDGGTGDDWMKGGSGADVFVFDLGHDNDTIVDFKAADDRLEISAALAAGQTADQIAQGADVINGDLVIDFGDGDMITLTGYSDATALADLIDII